MEKHIKRNVSDVLSRIESSCARTGRDPGSVMLLAATKNRSPENIKLALEAGITVVGENRVQEMLAKMERISEPVRWHFIGHLQRNKVKQVVGLVEMIHSVDSVRLAEEIDRRAGVMGVVQPVLLQVNIAEEDSKSGIEPGGVARALDRLMEFKNVELRGLSTIAPLVEDPEEVRWVFRGLTEISRELERAGGFKNGELSMGMTNDFEIAVEEGSTCVRIGTAIFGSAG